MRCVYRLLFSALVLLAAPPLVTLAFGELLGAGGSVNHNLVDRNVQGISSATEIKIDPKQITIDFWVHIGDIEATNVRTAIDTDHDTVLSIAEKTAYFNVIESRIHEFGFSLEIDGTVPALTYAPIIVDYGKTAADQIGTEPIQYNVTATAELPKGAAGEHTCQFWVTNTIDRPVLMKVFTLEDSGVRIAAAPGTFKEAEEAALKGTARGMTENVGISIHFGTGIASGGLPKAVVGGAPPDAEQDMESRAASEMQSFIRRFKAGELSLWLILGCLAASAFFGAAHGLAPGHGKTLVAAYLVGTSGRRRDAVILGLTVTATHTSSVILLCLFVIWLQSQYPVDMADVAVWLGIASGVIILGIGMYLLVTRVRALITGIEPEHGHSHGPMGEHLHDHGHDPDHPHDHGHSHDHPHDPPHSHVVGQPHTHADGSTHVHPVVTEEVVEVAPIDDAAVPSRDPVPATPSAASFPLWSLISLGISGGIVPCPTAMVVLLLSIRLRVPEFGLILILAFGVGLAGILTLIGLLMVSGRARMGTSPRVEWIVKRLPVVSALLVTAIGAWLTWGALKEAGYVG